MMASAYHVPKSLHRLLFNHAFSPLRRGLATETGLNDAPFESLFHKESETIRSDPAKAESHAVAASPVPPQQKSKARQLDSRVASHLAIQHMHNTTGSYGTRVTTYYQPQSLLSNPPGPKDVTLDLLLASQSHFGHSTALWNPANSRYIFGIRSGIHIISLEVTAQHLRRAAKVVAGVAEQGGIILFVGTRPGFDTCVVRAAELAAPAYHLFERWTPGSITNGQQILGKCRMKVIDEFDTEVYGFDDKMLDRPALKPDLVVCLNPLENHVMLHECALAGIPTMGIIDTDANPTWVTYPIPANDDSLRCVQVIAGVLGRAGQEGQRRRKRAAVKGIVTYGPDESLSLPGDFRFQRFSARNAEAKVKFNDSQTALFDTEGRDAANSSG